MLVCLTPNQIDLRMEREFVMFYGFKQSFLSASIFTQFRSVKERNAVFTIASFSGFDA